MIHLGASGHTSYVTCAPDPTTVPSSIDDAVPSASAALPRTELRVLRNSRVDDVTHCVDALGVTVAAVIDDEQHPLGIVSPTTLLRESARLCVVQTRPRMLASDAMDPVALVLPARTPLPQAAAAMAYEEASTTCLIDDEHRLVGLLTPIDVLRALAATAGYVLAPRGRSVRDPTLRGPAMSRPQYL
ncbi:MAG: CBS domain-containing protein [Myxococcota bacterium]